MHQFLEAEGIRDQVTVMASGGIRTAHDIAKAIALGADGVILGTAELVALGCTRCSNCERGRGCPFGFTTTDPELSLLVDPQDGAQRIGRLYGSYQRELRQVVASLGLQSTVGSARPYGLAGVCRLMKQSAAALSELDRRRLLASRPPRAAPEFGRRKREAEGGCGVIGIASSEPIAGRHLLRALEQMRNRGNGKGGGVAMAGLDPAFFGVPQETLDRSYLYAVAYLDPSARSEVEAQFIEPRFAISAARELPAAQIDGLEVPAPGVVAYFVEPKGKAQQSFAEERRLEDLRPLALADEFVYQTTFALNQAFYASLGDKRAFVVSHGKDLLVLKLVGYGDDTIHVYGLADQTAHVWIGHHRYPTKGRVWHPGGAHPFIGMHEALVHNGDFANYASVCSYLAQYGIEPLFLTDTEVSVLMFDLLQRGFGYSLEHVIESLAPTTERDFTRLPAEKQPAYRTLQAAHIHGSPDGPWFFLIAQTGETPQRRTARLIGITDTSMLRPQVFALQDGGPNGPSIGMAASEKQAIDAALRSLAEEDPRFGRRPDRTWVARGGSHTDGGAFIFEVRRATSGPATLICTDKFGTPVDPEAAGTPWRSQDSSSTPPEFPGEDPGDWTRWFTQSMAGWTYPQVRGAANLLVESPERFGGVRGALEVLTGLLDRPYDPGGMRRRSVLEIADEAIDRLLVSAPAREPEGFRLLRSGDELPAPRGPEQVLILDGSGFAPEWEASLSAAVRRASRLGWRELIVFRSHGHRFLGAGLGPGTSGVRLEVYGSPGDYLGSGIDGLTLIVHGSGQDQLAQIMKSGELVIHGDVGQTFMYAAKGGSVFVRGNAAGRPLINAVGRPKVVINGTCLDYLAESFMAGDPMNGGGLVVLNGVRFDKRGRLVELAEPYPGGNLFSLASGGALFVRDPRGKTGEDQLNGGEFRAFTQAHWDLILPLLESNERHFGIRVEDLLTVDGRKRPPAEVYRAIFPAGHKALQPEEAWVVHGRE